VDNIPAAPEAKLDKLRLILAKIFGAIGPIRENGLVLPVSDAKMGLGFCFVEYENAEIAHHALRELNGYALDKAHIFKVDFFDDLERYARVSETYHPPESREYKAVDTMNSWLLDGGGRDQFLIRYDDNVAEVAWNDAKRSQIESAYTRQGWTDDNSFPVLFSPHGNLLATVHEKGTSHSHAHRHTRTYIPTYQHTYTRCTGSRSDILCTFRSGADGTIPPVLSYLVRDQHGLMGWRSFINDRLRAPPRIENV